MGEAFITRRGGGGAAGLNFEVVGGTTQPKNPKKNTIWINTAQEITSWDFSAEMPFLRSNNKNKIVYPFYHTTKTENGITWTDNRDGSITANGTATAAALFRVSAFDSNADHEYLEAGTYTLSGCPAGGSDSTYLMELFILNPATNTNEAIGRDYGEGFTFTLEHGCKVRINLNVMSGATVSGIVFKPQLEKGGAATDFVKGDATGQIWNSTGTSSPVEFNALKKNGLQVYPISAKQYISGKWVDKTAKSYQGGKWVDWITYLYNLGDECEDITGGWTVIREGYGGSFTNSGEELVIQSGGAQNGVFCTTKNKVDLTNAKTVHFSVSTATGTSAAGIGYLVTNANSSWNDWQDLAASTWSDSETVVKEYTVNVPDVPGEYYIGFICYGGSDRSVGCNKIWLS